MTGSKEAAPARAASSGEEAIKESHATPPLARSVTKYANAQDSKRRWDTHSSGNA